MRFVVYGAGAVGGSSPATEAAHEPGAADSRVSLEDLRQRLEAVIPSHVYNR